MRQTVTCNTGGWPPLPGPLVLEGMSVDNDVLRQAPLFGALDDVHTTVDGVLERLAALVSAD